VDVKVLYNKETKSVYMNKIKTMQASSYGGVYRLTAFHCTAFILSELCC